MAFQSWVFSWPPYSIADAAAYNTSTTLTDVTPVGGAIKIPANLLQPGTEIEIMADGQFSNTGTPTLLIGSYWGGVAGVALAASAAITTITAATAWSWQYWYRGTVRAIGTAGSIQGQGRLYMPASLTQFQAPYAVPASAAARTVAIDTTIEKSVTIGAQWSASSASNTLTCNNVTLLTLN